MRTFETRCGSRVVRSFSNNGEGSTWTSCLYVNNGETITPTMARHKTEAGARRWAEKTLESFTAKARYNGGIWHVIAKSVSRQEADARAREWSQLGYPVSVTRD